MIDAAGFQAALNAASDGGAYNGETNAINLVAGSYSTQNNGNHPFTYNSTAPDKQCVGKLWHHMRDWHRLTLM